MKNSKKLIVFFGLFFFFLTTNARILASRYGHTATYINDRIYILGGLVNGMPTNEFLSIDVSPSSISSKSTELTFLDELTNMDFILPHAFAQTSLSKSKIMLFGGLQNNLSKLNNTMICYFDTESQYWYRANLGKISPSQLNWFQTSGSDNFYITWTIPDGQNITQIVKVNTLLNWSIQSSIHKVFIDIHGFTATLLGNGLIVYFGGSKDDQFFNTNNLIVYDTILSEWNKIPTDGDFPEPRRLHSAVVTPDARIIIYGGITLRLLKNLKQAAPLRLNDRFPKTSIAILDTSRQPFLWTIPQLTKDSLRPALLHGHTATMVGNVMIIAFGTYMLPTVEGHIYTPSNQIYMMDTTNVTHVTITKFVINNQNEVVDVKLNYKDKKIYSSPQKGGIIFGSIVAGILGGILFGVGFEILGCRDCVCA